MMAAETEPSERVETPRSDQFNIKKVGIQTNKPLNWHHGGYTCIDFICLNRRFVPVVTKEHFTKTLKCLARFTIHFCGLPSFLYTFPHFPYMALIFLNFIRLVEEGGSFS